MSFLMNLFSKQPLYNLKYFQFVSIILLNFSIQLFKQQMPECTILVIFIIYICNNVKLLQWPSKSESVSPQVSHTSHPPLANIILANLALPHPLQPSFTTTQPTQLELQRRFLEDFWGGLRKESIIDGEGSVLKDLLQRGRTT